MKTRRHSLALAILLAASASDGAQHGGPTRFVEGELLVKFKGGPRGPAAEHARNTLKHQVKRHFDFIGWQHVRLPAGMTVEDGLAHYKNLPDVLAVEPNGIMQANEPVRHEAALAPAGAPIPSEPNDPMFGQQYGLAKIEAATAWAITTGSTNVVVAVIDTGVNYNHEDLRDNMWRNPGEIPDNSIDDDGNGYVDDVYGIDIVSHDSDPLDEGSLFPGGDYFYHGTAVAGVLGAVANNSNGIAGLAQIQMMAIRVTTKNNTITYADLVTAFQYVTMMKRRGVNIRVSNNSYAGPGGTQAFEDAIDAAAREGVLSVTGAHNNFENGGMNIDLTPVYPPSYDSSNILATAASDEMDNLAWFSNYGRTNVDLAAPGNNIRTTHAPGASDYTVAGGTSLATPLVTGAAALIAAAYPSLSGAQIKSAIMDSVDALPAFTNKTVTGGRLNVGRALYFAARPTNVPPVIVLQPRSQVVEEDDQVGFTVIASGTPPFRYRWQFNGMDLPGATNSAVQWPSVGTNQAGGYSVIVSNAFGAVTSDVATLTVTVDPNPVFARITNSPLATIPGDALGAVWGDYDNDADVDLFVPRGLGGPEPDLLFRNNGSGAFTQQVSSILGMDAGDSWSGAWGDYDNDGDLDLLIANTGGQNNFLYRNEGGGNLSRTTAAQVGPIVSDGGNSFDCAWVDYDNDGWLDAFISNGGYLGNENEFLYHNNGGTFTRVTNSIIVNDGGQSYGIAWADYDEDGRLDVFLANASTA